MTIYLHRPLQRLLPVLLCCLALALAACATTTAPGGSVAKQAPSQPPKPGDQLLAYGVSLTLPPTWKVTGKIAPEAASKASLDSRRRNGERIALLETTGPAGMRGIESVLMVFLVNEQGTFMPRAHAEKISADELSRLARDIVQREHASARQQKTTSGLIDIQFTRETVNGNMAIFQRTLVMGLDARPVQLMDWDIFLSDGAGIKIRTVSDPENPGSVEQVISIASTLRVD
jgi:hypothetical protein